MNTTAKTICQPQDKALLIVQPHVAGRAELILGSTFEPGLGHFLVFGLGGVNAELLDSVELLPIPLATDTIRQRLAASGIARLLVRIGASGSIDLVEAVADNLAALQRLILAAPDLVQSIDVNPLLVGPAGAMAVDALIVPRRAS